MYKSDDEEDSDGDGFVPLPGRPAARFLPSTSARFHADTGRPTAHTEVDREGMEELADSGDEGEERQAAREAEAAKKAKKAAAAAKKKKGRSSVQPAKADDRAKYPMAAVQIDCVETKAAAYASKSYGYILVVRCVFSGYIFARAIPEMERGLLCRHLMDIFGNFGPPSPPPPLLPPMTWIDWTGRCRGLLYFGREPGRPELRQGRGRPLPDPNEAPRKPAAQRKPNERFL